MTIKTVEYKAKGYYGKKVDVPSKYARIAKGLVSDVLKLKNQDGLPKLLEKYGYANRAGEEDILLGIKELFFYKTAYNESDKPSFKVRLQELKDNLYLNVCLYGADKINDKKRKKVRKKSEEEVLRIDRRNSKIKERIEKILRDD